MKLPRPLSHSSINLYAECPQKWKLKYIDGLPEKPRHFFSFGKSMHSALEFFYGGKDQSAPDLGQLLTQYKHHWLSEGYSSPRQEREYFEDGQRILSSFYAKHAQEFKLPFSVEFEFKIEVDGVPVGGFIDRIDKLPDGTLSIIDYKTGKAIPQSRVKDDAQLTMYQMACEEMLGAKVSKLSFYHLPSLTGLEISRHDAGLVDGLRKRIVDTAAAIEREDFTPKPEERKCNWCDYKPHCPEFRHLYVTHHEGETPPELLDEEISALTAQLGKVRDQIRDLQATASDIELEIAADMGRKNVTQASGGLYDVELAEEETWEFADKEEIKRLLRSFGLYDKILVASQLQLQKLLRDPDLPKDFLAQVARLGRKKKTRSVKLTKVESA